MNLLELRKRVCSALAVSLQDLEQEGGYWTKEEIDSYINEGYAAFSMDTYANKKHVNLQVSVTDSNSFLPPSDMYRIISVQYNGKPLDQKRIDYLDTKYSGTAHYREIMGEGICFLNDWRKEVGNPRHWFYENNTIHCFPRSLPFTMNLHNNPGRRAVHGTLNQYDNVVNLPVALPTSNTNLIDVYVNGISQDYRTYSVIPTPNEPSRSSIQFTWVSDLPASEVEVVYSNTPILATKYAKDLVGGETLVPFTEVAVSPSSAYRVSLNGVTLSFGHDFNIGVAGSTVNVTLLNPYVPTGEDALELVVYDVQTEANVGSGASNYTEQELLSIDYFYKPADLVEDTDVPETLEPYHSAIWKYAVYMALSREGQQTQDFQKGNTYKADYEMLVEKARHNMSEPVDIAYEVQMPFIL